MKSWMEAVPEDKKERVTNEIANLINEERHEAEFLLTVKATLLMGRNAKQS